MDSPHASAANQPVHPEVVGRPSTTSMPAGPAAGQVVYVSQHAGPLRRWLSWLGWVGCFICLSLILGIYARHREYFDTSGGVQERYHSGAKTARDKVAIIEVGGVIASGEGSVKKQIDRVREDKRVKAVVLRIDSPGGTITGSDYIYHHLGQLKQDRKIPLVVSMGSIAASGGYYVAMAVGDEPRSIFAEPTTTTGSIGVIVPHYDLSGLLERLDIKDDSIVSHPRKRLLSMTKPLSGDDREVLQAYMDEAFVRFKDTVKSGRPAFRGNQNQQALDELATGEIFSASRACEKGLVDEIGFIEDAIRRAAELAGLAPDEYRVVSYRTPMTLMNLLVSARSADESAWEWRTLLEMSVPRAYYLATSWPTLATAP